jgi:hypothetical protein
MAVIPVERETGITESSTGRLMTLYVRSDAWKLP